MSSTKLNVQKKRVYLKKVELDEIMKQKTANIN